MTDEELWSAVLDRVKAGAIRPEYASAYWFKELRGVLDYAEAHVNIHNADEVVRPGPASAPREHIGSRAHPSPGW